MLLVVQPLHSVRLSDALHGALNAWDSPEDLIPSVTDRQHILLLLSATRGIKKGFAALISLCFFFGTFSMGLEGGIVNSLHKAHNNKETQLGRRGNGRGGGGGRRTIQRVAHITCGISRSLQNRFSVNVRAGGCFPHGRRSSQRRPVLTEKTKRR